MSVDRQSAERLKVLVVEPKDLVATRLKAQLEDLGHRVLGRAKEGHEAVAAAQRLHPSLIVIESKLPGSDGIDTARAIVTERAVPVILLADYAGAELVQRARKAGVVAYLTSLDRTRLRSAIDVALERFGDLQFLRREGTDVDQALETWALMDRAKKVLSTRLACSTAAAFLHILERTQSTGRSLRETAWTILELEETLSRLDFARSLRLIFDVVGGALTRPSSPRLSARPRLATALGTGASSSTGPML